jgi:hypothetical protein
MNKAVNKTYRAYDEISAQAQIEVLVNNFDFNRVLTVMSALGTPASIDHLKKEATRLLYIASKYGGPSSWEGFETNYYDGYLSLKFVVAEVDARDFEEEDSA